MKKQKVDKFPEIIAAELNQGERPSFQATIEIGTVATPNGKAGLGRVGVVLTDRRILAVHEGGFFSKNYTSYSIPWARVVRTEINGTGLGQGQLLIFAGDSDSDESIGLMGGTAELSQINLAINKNLQNASWMASNQPNPAPASPSGRNSNNPDITGELSRLAELHRSGVLTDQEFSDLKRRLIG